MGIGELPQELVEKVACYLGLDDILSCCLVSKAWRNAFNDDTIWFHLCAERSPVRFDSFTYIEDPCTVLPGFQWLRSTEEGLEPVCKWRERFMQEAHLTRNWLHGRHSKHVIIDYLRDDRDDFNFINIQCRGNLVIVPYSERREFYVYDTRESPLLTQIVKYPLNYMIENYFKLSKDKLVVAQCNLLQVYNLCDGDRTVDPSHVVLFDRPEIASLKIPHSDLSSWYNSEVGLYPCDVSFTGDHNGKYFIGAVYSTVPIRNPHFHIWDIETGQKIGVRYLPPSEKPVVDVCFSVLNDYVFILLKFSSGDNQNTDSIYRFDFKTSNFSERPINFGYNVPYVLFSDKFVLNVDRSCKNIYFWKHNDGKLVYRIVCDNRLNPLTLSVGSNHLLYAENVELSSVVKVVALSDPESSIELKVSFTVTSVNMVRDKMILVSVQMGILLYDLQTASILTAFDYEDCLWSNPSSSKVITRGLDGLYLLCFW